MIDAAPWTIRPVEPPEYAELGEIVARAYRALSTLPPNSDWYYDEIRNVERRATLSTVLVAVSAHGDVFGGVTYVSGPEDPYSEELKPGEAGIRMLGVAPECQGRGVGRALVEACVERARATGRQRIVLHTGDWMPAAQRLYRRLGFYRDESIDWEPEPGLWLRAFALDL